MSLLVVVDQIHDSLIIAIACCLFTLFTMWKHIPGVKKPAEKRKLSDNQRREHSKLYDHSHRRRKYDDKWEVEFPWLTLDDKHEDMVCRPCRAFPTLSDNASVFIKGTSNFKLDPIRKHNVSEKHIRAFGAERAAAVKVGESLAEKAIQALNTTQLERLQHLFRTSHALAKKSRPFSDFVWMCELDAAKGNSLVY